MSPKRPIISQRFDTTSAKTKAPAKSAAEQARDEKRETGPERDETADPTKATGGRGDRAVADPTPARDAASAASSSVASGAASVLGTKQTTKDVFDPTSKLDERADRARSEREGIRDRARTGLQDDAATGDGTTGIAEQGTGAISKEPAKRVPGAGLSSGGGAETGPDGEVTAKVKTDIANDPQFADNPIVDTAKRINTFTSRRTIEEADAANENAPASPAPAPEPTTKIEDTKGGVKFTHPDGSTTTEHRDGTKVEKSGSTTQITRPDGSTTTQSTNQDGETTVTDKDSKGKTTSETTVGTANPEQRDELDPEKAALLGLDRFGEKLRGPGVAGGGNTDPVEDEGFGSGAVVAPTVTGAAGNPLLGGGDGRAADVRIGGAGNVVLDPGGNNGTIDVGPDADPGFGGGGLEDDPFDNGQGPSLGIEDARPPSDSDSDGSATAPGDTDASIDNPFRLIDPSQSRAGVTNFGFTVRDTDDTDDTDDGAASKGSTPEDPAS
jgi:hypothetical protein